MSDLGALFLRAVFVENMPLTYFLGLCTFLALSRRTQTAFGLGVAVIAVILQHLLDRATTSAGQLAAFNHTFWWALGLSAVPLLITFFLPTTKDDAAARH